MPVKSRQTQIIQEHGGKVKRLHMDHIAEKDVGSFHCGLVHKPVAFQEALKIPEAKAAVDEEWGQKKQNPSVGCQESKTKLCGEEEWENSSRREADGLLSLEERRACKTPPATGSELCSRGTTSKTKKDTEQGASASQMAAAIFLDTISKLLGVAGETSDAISAYTQVKMTGAPRLLRMRKDKCLYLARVGRPHISWPANTLARSVTK